MNFLTTPLTLTPLILIQWIVTTLVLLTPVLRFLEGLIASLVSLILENIKENTRAHRARKEK